MIIWKAKVVCDYPGCTAHTTGEVRVDSTRVGAVWMHSVTGKGWTVPRSGCGTVRCPEHKEGHVQSNGGGDHVHREGRCDTSNCIEARRGDSRFYTIGGQLVPPGGR